MSNVTNNLVDNITTDALIDDIKDRMIEKYDVLIQSKTSECIFYQKLIEYLSDNCPINICHCLNLVKNCSSPKFLGYMPAKKHIDDNGNLILTFKFDDIVYDALWLIPYGYAGCHCDDKRYYLFPAPYDDYYFLMSCEYELDI